jgi:hypothetical protein
MTPIYEWTLLYIENRNKNMMLFPTSKTMQENLNSIVWVFLVFQQSQKKQAPPLWIRNVCIGYPHI